ncbi:hypothetical protein [Ammoniphilus resinae]|uniref:Uncharacterized protein n=1 Tax=Ammoniphilus resinae TaxID=861532 RepID=A0ABS4GS48_9BACL|nr:hypothetical protein [Ammoniphilus resinae]MBP1933106.1 hypothetical protein [Ammoniphilus resinae]
MHLFIAALTYLLILVSAYGFTIFSNMEEEKSEEIISRAFQNAYSILIVGLLVVYCLIILPHITLDHQTASYLILASKFVSILTLGGSLFILKRCLD